MPEDQPLPLPQPQAVISPCFLSWEPSGIVSRDYISPAGPSWAQLHDITHGLSPPWSFWRQLWESRKLCLQCKGGTQALPCAREAHRHTLSLAAPPASILSYLSSHVSQGGRLGSELQAWAPGGWRLQRAISNAGGTDGCLGGGCCLGLGHVGLGPCWMWVILCGLDSGGVWKADINSWRQHEAWVCGDVWG